MAYTVSAVSEVRKVDDLTVELVMSKPNPSSGALQSIMG